jgi:hypothetical protein
MRAIESIHAWHVHGRGVRILSHRLARRLPRGVRVPDVPAPPVTKGGRA